VIQEKPPRSARDHVHVFTVTMVAVVGVVVAVFGHPVPSLAAAVIITALSRLILGLAPSAEMPIELMSRFFGSVPGFKKSRPPSDDTEHDQDELPQLLAVKIGEDEPVHHSGYQDR
jgi:hypothetical protein